LICKEHKSIAYASSPFQVSLHCICYHDILHPHRLIV
jgi:hypothetical protein